MSYGHVVLAGTKKGFVPNAIKVFTRSWMSHSLVTMPDMLGVPTCIEAAEGGVDMTRFDTGYRQNPDQKYEVWNVKVPQDKKDAALVTCLNDLEIGYGFLQYPWFMWRALCRVFGKDIKSQSNWNHHGFICSQLCVAYLEACGLSEIFKDYGNGSIAPQDLSDIMHSRPDLFEMIEKRD